MKKTKSLTPHRTGHKRLKNIRLVKEILVEALMNDDLETFQDVFVAHVKALPKSRFAKESGLGRQTLYDLISEKKEFNPTLKTLGLILKTLPS